MSNGQAHAAQNERSIDTATKGFLVNRSTDSLCTDCDRTTKCSFLRNILQYIYCGTPGSRPTAVYHANCTVCRSRLHQRTLYLKDPVQRNYQHLIQFPTSAIAFCRRLASVELPRVSSSKSLFQVIAPCAFMQHILLLRNFRVSRMRTILVLTKKHRCGGSYEGRSLKFHVIDLLSSAYTVYTRQLRPKMGTQVFLAVAMNLKKV